MAKRNTKRSSNPVTTKKPSNPSRQFNERTWGTAPPAAQAKPVKTTKSGKENKSGKGGKSSKKK